MHFLKCNNCGHLNEVKNESLLFCSNCQKKLANNYAEWHKRNLELTLDDYKRLICISDEELAIETLSKKSKRPKGLKYWIGFAVMFAVFYAIGQFGGEYIVKFFKSEKTSKEILNQDWIKETYGNYGLTVETPVELNKSNLPIPESVKAMIDQMDVYDYMSAKGFKIMINSIRYNQVIGTINLQGAANGSVNEIKMQQGVIDFKYSEDYLYKGDIPGFIQRGTYKHNGIEIEFINTGFGKDLNMWQVMVCYQSNDDVGRIASKRVIESIEIKKVNNAL